MTDDDRQKARELRNRGKNYMTVATNDVMIKDMDKLSELKTKQYSAKNKSNALFILLDFSVDGCLISFLLK